MIEFVSTFSQKKIDSKNVFGYDFAGFVIFSKIENIYITTFISKTPAHHYQQACWAYEKLDITWRQQE